MGTYLQFKQPDPKKISRTNTFLRAQMLQLRKKDVFKRVVRGCAYLNHEALWLVTPKVVQEWNAAHHQSDPYPFPMGSGSWKLSGGWMNAEEDDERWMHNHVAGILLQAREQHGLQIEPYQYGSEHYMDADILERIEPAERRALRLAREAALERRWKKARDKVLAAFSGTKPMGGGFAGFVETSEGNDIFNGHLRVRWETMFAKTSHARYEQLRYDIEGRIVQVEDKRETRTCVAVYDSAGVPSVRILLPLLTEQNKKDVWESAGLLTDMNPMAFMLGAYHLLPVGWRMRLTGYRELLLKLGLPVAGLPDEVEVCLRHTTFHTCWDVCPSLEVMRPCSYNFRRAAVKWQWHKVNGDSLDSSMLLEYRACALLLQRLLDSKCMHMTATT